MTYIIRKHSRPLERVILESDRYSGISCNQADIPIGKVYEKLDFAIVDAEALEGVNSIGWDIYQVGKSGVIWSTKGRS